MPAMQIAALRSLSSMPKKPGRTANAGTVLTSPTIAWEYLAVRARSDGRPCCVSRRALAGNDQGISGPPKGGRRNATVHQRVSGRRRLHAQDMPNEGVVGLVVDQIVEGHEQRQRPDHDDLDDAGLSHGAKEPSGNRLIDCAVPLAFRSCDARF